MSDKKTEIDSWLMALSTEQQITPDTVWEAGFDVDRQLVHSKFGPYKRLFLRPPHFVKRFYHTLYPLPIEEWHCTDQVKLYDGFCTIDIVLDVRFQATYEYAVNNIEILTELNEHIKNAYHDAAFDLVNRELLNLSDGGWVQQGLEPTEKKICFAINEMLILQKIQSEVKCQLKPHFENFPDVQFAKEKVYLSVLKKSFEFNEAERDEIFRQQQLKETQKIDHKRQQLQRLNELADVERQRQQLQTENYKQLLQEKAEQQQQIHELKKELQAQKVKQNSQLKQQALTLELEEKENLQEIRRLRELAAKEASLLHQSELKQKQLDAEIAEYEKQQETWREAKNKNHAEELDLKHRQRQLEFETDVGYKQRYELQRLAMQEESYGVRKNADVYLKREIELLELEKQRLALQESIKAYKAKEKADDGEE